MDRLTKAITSHRRAVIAVFLALALICAVLMLGVSVNYKLADYLPPDAESTVALGILNDEFGSGIPNTRVMVSGLTLAEAEALKSGIAAVDGVTGVMWLDDVEDLSTPVELMDPATVEQYWRDGSALYQVTVADGRESSTIDALYELIGENGAIGGDAANTANLLYVSAVTGYVINANGARVPEFTAYINGEKVENCVYNKSITNPNELANQFYTYSESDGVYALNKYTKTDNATSVSSGTIYTITNDTYFKIYEDNNQGPDYNAKNAVVIDLVTDDGITYYSLKDMADGIKDKTNPVQGFTVSYIYNGSDNAGANTVSYIFITGNKY